MDENYNIEHFYEELLAYDSFEFALSEEFEDKAQDIIEAIKKKNMDKDTSNKLYDVAYDLVKNEGVEVYTLEAGAPYDDIFDIQIMNYGPVFWILAVEFDDVEFFESFWGAFYYAVGEWTPFIDTLVERRSKK